MNSQLYDIEVLLFGQFFLLLMVGFIVASVADGLKSFRSRLGRLEQFRDLDGDGK